MTAFFLLHTLESGQNIYSCDNEYMTEIRDSTGFITSPNYPEPYTNNASCLWHIMTEDNLILHLSFLKFEIEEG